MNDLITSITISLICVGVFVCTWDKMIFEIPVKWIKNKVHPKWLIKPIFGCLICMSSFWTILYWIFSGMNFNLIKVILITAGINTIITALISNIVPDEEG